MILPCVTLKGAVILRTLSFVFVFSHLKVTKTFVLLNGKKRVRIENIIVFLKSRGKVFGKCYDPSFGLN